MNERMWAILRYLEGRPRDPLGRRTPDTPNGIGFSIGVEPRYGAQYRSRGPGSIIASALTGLERRGYVQHTSRPDGLSGSAYRITDAGVAALQAKGKGLKLQLTEVTGAIRAYEVHFDGEFKGTVSLWKRTTHRYNDTGRLITRTFHPKEWAGTPVNEEITIRQAYHRTRQRAIDHVLRHTEAGT